MSPSKFEILDPNDLDRIHDASLRILETVGVSIARNETAIKLLQDAGAIFDEKKRIAKIPAQQVESSLKKIPKGGRIYCGRNRKHDIDTDKQICFRGAATADHIYDPDTNEHRPVIKKDLMNIVRLCDALENIGIVLAPTPHDQSARSMGQYMLEVMLNHTEKHVGVPTYGGNSTRDMIKMASIVAGGMEELTRRPIISGIVAPSSPLTLDRDLIESVIEFASHSIPIEIGGMPISGSTAPVTLAGAIAQANAENIAVAVLAQLVNDRVPLRFYAETVSLDPRTGMPCCGSVERAMMNAAMVQLCKGRYGVETWVMGGLSDSMIHDEQAGYERVMNMMLAALSGANGITVLGTLESCLTISQQQLVIDNEIAGAVRRCLRGIEVNDETLAISEIKNVGPGGHYLARKHTLQHISQEHYILRITNRKLRNQWIASGSMDIAAVARREAKRILETHMVEPLNKETQRQLSKIVHDAETNSIH